MSTEDPQSNRRVPLLPPYWFVQRFMEAEFARDGVWVVESGQLG